MSEELIVAVEHRPAVGRIIVYRSKVVFVQDEPVASNLNPDGVCTDGLGSLNTGF